MTTRTYTSPLDHTTDAGFRAWGSELGVNLALAGLVQTADTGQINWGTAVRPGTHTAAGYEIWRLPDSSLYFKFEFGTAGGGSLSNMWITVGTGSNGSGSLTGQQSTRSVFFSGNVAASATTNYATYLSVTNNSLSIVFKMNSWSGSYPMGVCVVGKSVDSSGAPTSVGFMVIRSNSSSGVSAQSVRTAATAETFSDASAGYAAFPGQPASSLAGGNYQAYQFFLNLPDVQPFAFACGVALPDAPKLTSFSVAMVGGVSRTYLSLGSLGLTVSGYTTASFGLAAIYE